MIPFVDRVGSGLAVSAAGALVARYRQQANGDGIRQKIVEYYLCNTMNLLNLVFAVDRVEQRLSWS